MDNYEAARKAELAKRTGISHDPVVKGDGQHLLNIGRLLQGMDEGVQHSVPGNEDKTKHVDMGYQMLNNALEKHNAGDHMGAASYATLAAHHATELARLVAPKSVEDAQSNFDPYSSVALDNGANDYVKNYIDSVNESLNKGK